MAAFAALLSLDGDGATAGEIDAVASALSAMTGRITDRLTSGPCTLLSSPLHAWDEPAIAVAERQVATVGAIAAEGRLELARALGFDPATPSLRLAAAAFARWGDGALTHLRGEYALVSWDRDASTLRCARDPLGVRLLYVGSGAGLIVVSNSIDAVLAHPRIANQLDGAALVRFLAEGTATNGVSTPFRSIRQVPEAHTLVMRRGHASLSRHWHPPPAHRVDVRETPAAIAREFRRLLGAALHDRTRDQPFSILLSGGLDSTALAVLGAEGAARMRAITFRYPLPSVADEPALATAVAARLGIPVDVVDGVPAAPLDAERRGAIPSIPADEPLLSNWRAGLARAAAFSTLAVHGDDGDALLAPKGGARLLGVQRFPSVAAETAKMLLRGQRPPYLGLRLRERLGLTRPPQLAPSPSWLSAAALQLLDADAPTILGCPVTAPPDEPPGSVWSRLLRNVPRDFAASIDPVVTRLRLLLTLPLMDSRVIAFAESLPPIPWCQRKHLMRVAFGADLPDAVARRVKTPVRGLDEYGVEQWRRSQIPSILGASVADPLIEWIHLERWRGALTHGDALQTRAAWRVLMLDAWLQHTGASRCTH